MKKFCSFLVCLLFIVLVGCGSNEATNATIVLPEDSITIKVGETYEILPYISESGLEFAIKNDDTNTVSIDGDSIQGKTAGCVNLEVYLVKNPKKVVFLTVEVVASNAPTFTLTGVEQNEEAELNVEFNPLSGITAKDIEDGNVTQKIKVEGKVDITKCGEYKLTYSVIDLDGNETKLERIITVVVGDHEDPVISIKQGSPEVLQIEYGKVYDASDLVAIDNLDGDISDKIEIVTPHDTQRYNVQIVKVQVKDAHGNKATFERSVQVVWPYYTQVIGHAGSYYGCMNSEESILASAEYMHYQAIEIDVRQTSDGIFILSHDATFAGVNIADTKYTDLVKLSVTSTRLNGFPKKYNLVKAEGGKYTAKICTLERYLQICRDYGCTPIIELKGSKGITGGNTSRMQALMNVIDRVKMLDKVVLLSSDVDALIWTRNNGYDYIPCQLLSNSCESQTVLDNCIKYHFDLSCCVTYGNYANSDTWLQKYIDAGCKISVYTFTYENDYGAVQKWINKGVNYVTCDWTPLNMLNFIRTEDHVPGIQK